MTAVRRPAWATLAQPAETVAVSYDLDRFAAHLRSRNLADRTITFRLWFCQRVEMMWPDASQVTEEDAATFLSDPDFSQSTRSCYFTHLRSLFAWLARSGRIPFDPLADVERPRQPRSHPRPLTAAEAQSALDRATTRGDDDLRAMLLLGMYAGLRAHEVAKMHSRDVSEDYIHVRGKGGREALLPTHPLIWEEARRRKGYWFPSTHKDGSGRRSSLEHIGSLTVSVKVSRLFWAVGIEEGSFHRCRHYYGTSLLRAGVNLRVVQELMRHASLATTAAYLGVDEKEKTAAIALLGRVG